MFGIVAGVVFVNHRYTAERNSRRPLSLIFILASLAILMPFLTQTPIVTFDFYFAFMLAFEVAFVVSMNGILKNASKEDVPCLMVIYMAWCSAAWPPRRS